MELFTMTCRNCGGKLNILKESDQCICQNCGTEYYVSYSENTISIKLLTENIEKIQTSSQNVAIELSLGRLRDEVKDIWVKAYTLMNKSNHLFCLEFPKDYQKSLELNEQKGSFTFNPRNLRILLDNTLNREQNRIFPNSKTIKQIKESINECEIFIQRLETIEQQQERLIQELKK